MNKTLLLPLLFFGCLSLAYTVHAHDPIKSSDMRWAQELTEEQIAIAKAIIDEAAPRVQALREEVQAKMRTLKNFCYTDVKDHEELILLGQQLQLSREALRHELITLDNRLMSEAGVSLDSAYRGRNCGDLTESETYSPTKNLQVTSHSQNHNPHHQE